MMTGNERYRSAILGLYETTWILDARTIRAELYTFDDWIRLRWDDWFERRPRFQK